MGFYRYRAELYEMSPNILSYQESKEAIKDC